MDQQTVKRALEKEFSPNERTDMEAESVALRESQPETFLSDYDTVASLRLMRLSQASLAQTLREFNSISAWHTMKGRSELAAQYQRRADVAGQVLAETNCHAQAPTQRRSMMARLRSGLHKKLKEKN